MSMRDPDGTLIGWGVAAGAYPVIIAPTRAMVRLNADETVEVCVGGHEMGQGLRTAIALVASETARHCAREDSHHDRRHQRPTSARDGRIVGYGHRNPAGHGSRTQAAHPS